MLRGIALWKMNPNAAQKSQVIVEELLEFPRLVHSELSATFAAGELV
jgi:hypothetical protein